LKIEPERPCGLKPACRVLPPALLHRLIVLARARTHVRWLGVPIALEKGAEAVVAPVVTACNGDTDRNYMAIVTGWSADEWASRSPPHTADTTIPQGIPCTRLANLVLAPSAEAKQLAANAQEHIAVPIDARADSVRPTAEARAPDDAESIAPGADKSAAPSIPEPPAPQASTSAQLSPQTDGAAAASPTTWFGASPTVATANVQKHIAVPIDARADSVRRTAEARAPDDAESIAPGADKSAAPSIPEPPAPQASTSAQLSPQTDGAAAASPTT
jgi:hypothetical protein